ncbi:MAG: hypothetical protein PHD03_04130 [Bacilli bacterium]|nr:hypothetical protein [Bacilli bacterium]MDD4407068.1 hypothetical protein [Bacilli bacterium]
MIIDFLVLNITNIYIASLLLSVLYLNDKFLYIILIIDILLNGIPLITMLIIILFKFKIYIFKIINQNDFTLMLLLTCYYFIFGTLIYSIYNDFNLFIINYLLKYLAINLIIYYAGIKYLTSKYN